jgi:hypothetical protein
MHALIRTLRRPGRARGAILLEIALFTPLLLAFFIISAQVWYGFARQETYSKTAASIAEWAARNGGLTATMTGPTKTLMLQAAGVEGQTTYLHVRVLDPATGACPSALAASGCEIGSTQTLPANGVITPPADNGWDSVRLSGVGGLDVPYGSIIEVEVWSHQSLTGQNALGVFSGVLTPRWAIPLGRAVSVGTAP